ncbi:TetR/AcrR family transcriptional regulator [Paucibacter sp. APW11]|uniref:TetR/AcrR family transcriptional regulator n=1 Tax=Roseateles aquae TaxID=3077235 RepID=A0ABU3PIL9_9BURK|nr:TetR/AcrR family transcriptional regulator [Paucibacter sp. APW11]MDT9002410.1 TetR/AcrR family transcriptional regulator [Paucibacter sp. APW11]
MNTATTADAGPASIRDRLLQAAKTCFLADDYHAVSTRRIADLAGANQSMIRYYFGSKEGLYEEMLRSTLQPLLDVLDSEMLATPAGFADYLRLYYRTMLGAPEFPRLIIKVLALRAGPGRRFIQQLLERGRSRGAQRVEQLKAEGQAAATLDPDVLRMSFVSLAMTPLLLKEVFEEQMEREMDASFLDTLAQFNGQLISAGLAALRQEAA